MTGTVVVADGFYLDSLSVKTGLVGRGVVVEIERDVSLCCVFAWYFDSRLV